MRYSKREREGRDVADALNEIDGVSVDSVYDLVNTSRSYASAIPTLVRLLGQGFRDPVVLEGIVRALSVREAKGQANTALFDLFFALPEGASSLKWAVGNALKVIIRPEDFERVRQAVTDSTNGKARQELVAALGKIKTPEAEKLLVDMLDDDDVAAHALEGLENLKSPAGKTKAQILSTHSKIVIRNEAKKYLKKLDQAKNVRPK